MIHRLLISTLAVLLLGVSASVARSSANATLLFHDTVKPAQLGPFTSGYDPGTIQTAYDFSPLYDQRITGAGQTAAFIEVDRLSRPDLSAFDNEYGLPGAAVTEKSVGAATFRLAQGPETNLDLEWFHALAPSAAMRVYYIKNQASSKSGWTTLATALKTAAADGANIISLSFGACGPSTGSSVVKNELATLAKARVSVFVSSGDDGDHPGPVRACGSSIGVAYPGGDPSVVSVGGTSAQIDDTGALQSETAWDGSGGGSAAPLLRAAWQVGLNLPNSTYRWAPDVSFLADPQTGVNMVFGGRESVAGGTSLGAPAWAAVWALVLQNAKAHGVTPASAPHVIYSLANSSSYSTTFHDITDGSNGTYSAGPGWDAVTGWGTPDVAAIVAATGVSARAH